MVAYEKIQTNKHSFSIGVISDTHIPDRVDHLHPFLIERLNAMEVDMIFHGGDISIPSVLRELEAVAPVRAAAGNRDLLLAGEIPVTWQFDVFGLQIVLTHGHLNPKTYWKDKVQYITRGYNFERYQKRLREAFPKANVIVFGHTHHPENVWIDEQLFFNPGSVSHGDRYGKTRNFGFLKFFDDGRIESILIPLEGAEIRHKKWEIPN